MEKTGADLVSTSVTGDGSVMSTSTWFSDASVITGTIFGSGPTTIRRETETNTGINSDSGRRPGSLMKGRTGVTARSD